METNKINANNTINRIIYRVKHMSKIFNTPNCFNPNATPKEFLQSVLPATQTISHPKKTTHFLEAIREFTESNFKPSCDVIRRKRCYTR